MHRLPKFSLAMLVILAAYSPTALFADECDDWRRAQPGWLWCENFFSFDLTERYEDVSTNSLSWSPDSVEPRSGSMTITYEPKQVGVGWIVKAPKGGFPDHIFVRWYHKFETVYERFPPKMARVGYRRRSGDWKAVFRIHAWLTDAGELTADVFAENSSQASDGWLPVQKSGFFFSDAGGEWVPIEMEVKLNTPGGTDGAYRMWVDDKLVVERTDVDLRGSTSDQINEVMFDGYWNGGADRLAKRWFDSIVISTERIGAMRQVRNVQ